MDSQETASFELARAIISPAIPAFVRHVLETLGHPAIDLRASYDRVVSESSGWSPAREWRLYGWGAPSAAARVDVWMPCDKSGEVKLTIHCGDRSVQLIGPPGRVVDGAPPAFTMGEFALARVVLRAPTPDDLARVEQAVDAFLSCPRVPMLNDVPSLPMKWRRRRPRNVPLATHAWVVPGEHVRLVGTTAYDASFDVLIVHPEGHLALGLAELWNPPMVLELRLERGRPLPRLSSLSVWDSPPNCPIKPIPDEPSFDRVVEVDTPFGLLRRRTGPKGREWLERGLWIDALLREARFSTDAASKTLDVDDASAPWTVEWCVIGNGSYVSGHPGGDLTVFARSEPPSPGEERIYRIHVSTPHGQGHDRWRAALAKTGLVTSLT